MKLKHYLLITGSLFLLLSLTFIKPEEREAPSLRKKEVLMNLVRRTLAENHYSPKDLNNDFSKALFKTYIERLDFNKRLLTEEDYDQLKNYETLIDDQIKRESFDFFSVSYDLIDKRITLAQSFCEELLDSPFNFNKKETIELDPEKIDFCKNEKALKERWRKTLKHQVLVKLEDELEKQEKNKDKEDFEEKSFEELEKTAREKVKKTYDQYFSRREKMDENDYLSTYMNVITMGFDPHTNYYPPKDKENFDISMSGRLEGIGATLQEKDGYIKVMKIVPGSASWKQGELKAGHIILKVGQGEDEPVDIVDMRLDDAVKLIRGPKGTEVRLTIKKLDGTETVVPIVRDVVILEETYAKSVIIKNKKLDENIGYIHLPKFYADFSGQGGRSCFEDVKKELEKLTAIGVDGIILDLRDNGGGSLRDVVDMGGLFIEKGPIVQVKDSYGRKQIHEDYDPTVQYDGKLIIMVNSLSASASEILAAAMQDYKRAVIVGSKSTYGKGTVQNFVDLDRFLPSEYDDVKPLGALKLTIQKFYRVDGGATQLKGVVPDIIFPDAYDLIEYGEKEMDFALTWDEIEKAKYTEIKGAIDNLPSLKANAKKRMAKDSVFIKTVQKAKVLKQLRDETITSLNLETYKEEKKKNEALSKKYDNIYSPIDDLSINMLKVDSLAHLSDTTYQARFKDWEKTLKKDSELFESLSIIHEMED